MRLTSESIKSLHEGGEVISASRPAFRKGTSAVKPVEVRPASVASVKYMKALIADRWPQATDEYVQSIIDQGQSRVSRAIDNLKDLPRAPRVDYSAEVYGIPVGRYALRDDEGVVHFYRIKKDGLFVQASDDLHRIAKRSHRASIISAIQEDPKAAAILYGLELGDCGRCGRTLTDEDSRARGIGPVCNGKNGWNV